MRIVALSVIVVAVAAGCGGSSATPADTSPFAYDASAPLHYVDHGRVNHDYPIAVDDVSYALPGGKTIEGFLVVPPGKGPFPGVVYLHGSGGDRSELLVPATWLSARGVVALTITTPRSAYSPGASAERKLREQRAATVADVVAVRRAADVLLAQPMVDGDRLGLVGWSAGARLGASVAGVDRRIGAFDLFSGGSTPVSVYAAQAPPALRPAVTRELGAIDPLRWIRNAPPGSVLLEDGRSDDVVPRAALVALARAAGKAAEVRWYDQGHAPGTKAFAEGLDWMAAKLGVGGPVVKGANAGP
jgi:dienelactone hydrolase